MHSLPIFSLLTLFGTNALKTLPVLFDFPTSRELESVKFELHTYRIYDQELQCKQTLDMKQIA